MSNATGEFVMNLDRKSNPKRAGELTEDQVVRQFKSGLKDKFVSSTAAVGVLYPNALTISKWLCEMASSGFARKLAGFKSAGR